MLLEFLADRPEFIPQLGSWYFQEWGHKEESRTLQTETDKLHGYLNRDSPPLILLATKEHELLGAAQLKFYEMNIYPDKEHWLGGVYVSTNHRGQGIAAQIITRLISFSEGFSNTEALPSNGRLIRRALCPNGLDSDRGGKLSPGRCIGHGKIRKYQSRLNEKSN